MRNRWNIFGDNFLEATIKKHQYLSRRRPCACRSRINFKGGKKLKHIGVVFAILLISAPVNAQRYFVATAFDTEGCESGYSNEVVYSGGGQGVTFAWSANSEPDLAGYRLWSSKIPGGPYIPAGSYITCGAGDTTCCTETLAIEDPKNIQLQGEKK